MRDPAGVGFSLFAVHHQRPRTQHPPSHRTQKGAHPMSLGGNKAIVRRFIEKGCNEQDLDTFDAVISADCAWVGDKRGPEAFKQWIARQHTRCPDWHQAIENIVAEGDQVGIFSIFTGTDAGEIEGWWTPTGKKLKFEVATFFDLAGTKITAIRDVQDSLGMCQQLGLVPPWEELVEQAKSKQA